MPKTKLESRENRKSRIRAKIKGTPERPRLSIFRSSRHMFAQVIDDENNKVLATAGTMSKTMRAEVDGKKKMEQAKMVGKQIASVCKTKGIDKVVFDRNGFIYHGRVAALAAAAREAGLQF